MKDTKSMNNTTVFKGFTLVEILISLGIVGVLGGLVVPGLLHNIDEQRLRAQAKGGYATLLQALELLSNDWEGELAANRLGVDPRANTTTAGLFANLNYRIKAAEQSENAAGATAFRLGITEPIALTNILVLPNNVMLMSITQGAPSTLNMDINGVSGPNLVGTDIFRFQLNFSPDAVAGLSPFDARISPAFPDQIARWHVLTDTKNSTGT
jgi:prepilin-type N-terminal cleavage/methylation domain-containing protein